MKKKLLAFTCIVFVFANVFSQTAVTSLPYGSSTISKLFLKGTSFYFLGKPAADAQEWYRFNTSTNTLTQLTNDHYRTTGGTIFRAPSRIGDNVFVATAKPTTQQDIEFSRFDLTTGTEAQWIDLFPGISSNGISPNYSDPIVYGEDPATGYVYFRPSIAGEGNQMHYWKPSDNSITKLASVGGSTGIGQNSSSFIVFIGDTLYSSATINATDGLLCMHKSNGGYRFVNGGLFKNVRDLVVLNNKLYFSGRNNAAFPDDDYNMYVYNPSATNGPVRLTAYTNTEADGNLTAFTVGPDGTLYANVTFYSTNPAQGSFFSVNPTTDVVTYRNGPTTLDRHSYLFSTLTHVYVVRITGTTRDIYKIKLSDNSSTKINTSSYTSSTAGVFASNNRFYFSATEATYGAELYEIDLATDVVTRRSDINAGAASATPANFVQLGTKLYFSAATGAGATLDREIYAFDLPGTVLPVSLLNFTAQKQAAVVSLSWRTASEQNSRAFNIQHSEDGLQFKTIGTVAAAGNSSSTRAYSFTHSNPGKGENYYRLQQTDIDGKSMLSAVRKIQIEYSDIVLLNNPVVHKQIQLKSDSKQLLTVTNNEGKLLLKTTVTKGFNTIDASNLPAGIYFVRTANGSQKVLLQ